MENNEGIFINNENVNDINNDTNYKEVQIKEMLIDGKKQEGNIITIDNTKGKQEINVTVYTQDIETVQNKEKGISVLHEWLKKGIFRNKRQ